jgi:hypothetical protein
MENKSDHPTKHIHVSQELLERAKQVRGYVAATNAVVKELMERGVEIQYFHNGKELPDDWKGLDFEIRMHLPTEPIQL